jgi:hypothetical protein
MPEPEFTLAHNPFLTWFFIVVTVAALFATAVNLRNVPLWLLRATGRRAPGVVTRIELVTGPTGAVLRRPLVAFTAGDGREIVSAPVLYRPRTALDEGSAVTVSYAPRNPARVVVHGYDFRAREVVFAAAGVAIAIVVSTMYFHF